MKPTTTFKLTLQGEGGATIRLLRAMLKGLGRRFGVRCLAIERIGPANETDAAGGEIRGPASPSDEREGAGPCSDTPCERGESQER